MPTFGVWNPIVEGTRCRAWSGWPASAPGVRQPPQSMMVARYSPRLTLSCAEAGEPAARPSATMPMAAAALTMILRIGLGSLRHDLHADLRNETFRAYRRSFPVLSGIRGRR